MRDGCGVSASGIGEDMSFAAILQAVEDVVMDRFVSSWADRTMRRFTLTDTMQVIVERDVSSSELDIHAGLALR